MRIVVVGTDHEECDQATAAALLDILESIRAEVVFLEIPPKLFPAFVDGTDSNLESRAAGRYRQKADAVLVPVDLQTPE